MNGFIDFTVGFTLLGVHPHGELCYVTCPVTYELLDRGWNGDTARLIRGEMEHAAERGKLPLRWPADPALLLQTQSGIIVWNAWDDFEPPLTAKALRPIGRAYVVERYRAKMAASLFPDPSWEEAWHPTAGFRAAAKRWGTIARFIGGPKDGELLPVPSDRWDIRFATPVFPAAIVRAYRETNPELDDRPVAVRDIIYTRAPEPVDIHKPSGKAIWPFLSDRRILRG